jgi:hypothetical protein
LNALKPKINEKMRKLPKTKKPTKNLASATKKKAKKKSQKKPPKNHRA